MTWQILIHNVKDSVGIAIQDIDMQGNVAGLIMENHALVRLQSLNQIPLAHKISLRSIQPHEPILIYGAICGSATQAIAQGEHVHVHNMISERWK